MNNESILSKYGENLTEVNYIVNPAVARDKELKELVMVLLTPEKSACLVGKPGIGKTAIVEGLAYRMQHNDMPNALKGYMTYVLPLIIVVVYLKGYYDKFSSRPASVFAGWMAFAVCLLGFIAYIAFYQKKEK